MRRPVQCSRIGSAPARSLPRIRPAAIPLSPAFSGCAAWRLKMPMRSPEIFTFTARRKRRLAEVLPQRLSEWQCHVSIDHDAQPLVETPLGLPTESLSRLRRVTNQYIDLCWTLIARIVFDVLFPLQVGMGNSCFDKLADRVGFASSQHEIVAFTKLQNPPHAFDVFRCKAPISLRVQISEEQFLLQPLFDRRISTLDFASDNCFAAPRAFMVEHNDVACATSVALSKVNGRPI